MSYILSSIISALFFALTFYLRKQAARFMSVQAALMVEVIIEFLLMLLVFIFFAKDGKTSLTIKSAGMYFALLAGVTVTAGVFLNIMALKSGFLSRVIAITSPAQIMFGLLVGLLLVGETITIKQLLGTGLGVIAIVLITQ